MKASDLFLKALENEGGVEYIFDIPGEENLDFLDSLSRSSIKLVLVRHEQAAGFMAATSCSAIARLGYEPVPLGSRFQPSADSLQQQQARRIDAVGGCACLLTADR